MERRLSLCGEELSRLNQDDLGDFLFHVGRGNWQNWASMFVSALAMSYGNSIAWILHSVPTLS